MLLIGIKNSEMRGICDKNGTVFVFLKEEEVLYIKK